MNLVHQMQRLQNACLKNGPLCIGLDTSPLYIPKNIISKYKTESLAVLAYNKAIIENCAAFMACCKVQIAYYEQMGIEGMKTYVETLQALKNADIPFISDVKRGDIADTARSYAMAHFSGDFESDIITVNPYMGFDTLTPFIEFCEPKYRKSVFVLLRTSNAGMNDIENLEISAQCGGGRVFEKVGEKLLEIQKNMAHQYGYDENAVCSPVGAVVGCTEEQNARQIRNAYPNIFFLIPGYGAQGGKARIAGILLQKAGGVVNSSRGILCAWKNDEALKDKIENQNLTLDDIVESAQKAAKNSKIELLQAKANIDV